MFIITVDKNVAPMVVRGLLRRGVLPITFKRYPKDETRLEIHLDLPGPEEDGDYEDVEDFAIFIDGIVAAIE